MSEFPDGSDRPNPRSLWQNVTNEHWPPLEVARTLRDVPADRQIKVIARVVFEVDGEQQLPAVAVRWTSKHVCVRLGDRRLQVGYLWLAPSDVTRA